MAGSSEAYHSAGLRWGTATSTSTKIGTLSEVPLSVVSCSRPFDYMPAEALAEILSVGKLVSRHVQVEEGSGIVT